MALIVSVGFEGMDDDELATTVKVLRAATQRLTNHLEGND
jgi:hypothetical protein